MKLFANDYFGNLINLHPYNKRFSGNTGLCFYYVYVFMVAIFFQGTKIGRCSHSQKC